jgi:DNA helicase-2/ATP-dependent DNA helicase PcrA
MNYLQQELRKLMKNDRQREAYLCEDNCVVQAGPGSGKTATLTLKIMRLLSENISSPRGLACLTFNNEAVREFKSRLKLLGLPYRPNIFLGTVHSFCLSCIIRPFTRLFRPDLPKPLRVASEDLQSRCLQKAMDQIGVRIPYSQFRLPFDRYRRTHLDRKNHNWLDDEEYARAIEKYESILRKNGYLDFDDLILIALEMIEKEKHVRDCLSARFPWFVVDEYQDLGYPLHRMMIVLLETCPISIFAVGDPDQSIYGFIGANPKYLKEIAERDDVTSIQLGLNYRCGQNIIDGSCVILAPAAPRKYKSGRTDDRPGEIFFFHRPNGLKDQALFIVEQIIPKVQDAGYEPKDIAILFIDKNDASVIIKALEMAGIQYAGERDQRYRRSPVTRWVEEMAQWCCGIRGRDGIRFNELVTFWIGLLRKTGLSINDDQHLKVMPQYFAVLASLQVPDMELYKWLRYLEEFLALNKVLALIRESPEEEQSFKSLVESCQKGQPLGDFKVGDLAGCGPNTNTVSVTTLHSSKGLQFDVVIIPGLEEGRLPSWGAKSEPALREARRTFYVGFTRARNLVYLLHSGWYTNQYGKTFNKGPSQFVKELRASISK